MTNDLELLKQLEKEIGTKLEQAPLEKIGKEVLTAFATDDNGHVRGLSICAVELTGVPASLSKFQRLEKLVLWGTRISDISNLKELKRLTLLCLYRNQISDISSLKELKGLTWLVLGESQINDISALKELNNPKKLDLRYNKISQLPAEFLDLDMEIKWKYDGKDGIFLEGNPMEEPPMEIIEQGNEAIRQYFKSLEDNSLKQLEKEIGMEFKQVSLKEIGPNAIIAFAQDVYGKIKGLSICSAKLTQIPAVLLKFQQLKKLDLSRNQIRDIQSLKELKGLKMLSLHKNQISDISSLKELKNLEKLYLQNNRISKLPAEILDLGMKIKWKQDLFYQPGIFMEGNPLETPPVEIIKQGNEAIRQYFKSLEGKKQALNEVKVLLVGEGAAGKTSLVKRLLGQDFDKDESQTHGININTWEITVDNTNIKVRLWDFGGQEIMHATHQFFLSKRSLYILVLDVRKDEKTEYWLNHIKSFGGDSPVMVVINKIDENPGFDVNRRFLKEKYPNIKGFYRLSCASGSGIHEFKKELTKKLAAIELIRTTWANSWFQVKKQLEEMKDNFISYDTYQQICTDAGIKDEKEQDTLVDFLNDLGVILHFKEFHLQDTHVLEPKWITNAVYKIINSEILSTGKGVLELRRLGEILKAKKGEKTPYKYPSDKYKYIFQLMKKFELCFSIDEDKILVPDLLEVGEPHIDFPYTGALKFRICYNFLPKSVMPRFIVRSHRDIKNKLSWRTGVVLENKGFNATAVVKADQREKIINIFVNGTQKRDYFAHILHTFREINNSFEQIEVDECVPLPGKTKIAVNYLHLLRLERMGQAKFLPEKAERNYNVKELLEGIKPEKERQKEVVQLEREGKIVFQQNIQQIQQTLTEVDVDVDVDVNLSITLPTLQEEFDDLKELLLQLKPGLKEKLTGLGDDLNALSPKTEKEKLTGPLNNLRIFLKKLGDDKSDYSKILRGAKKGVETLQKVGRAYNKVAQWLALPQVPKVFLK